MALGRPVQLEFRLLHLFSPHSKISVELGVIEQPISILIMSVLPKAQSRACDLIQENGLFVTQWLSAALFLMRNNDSWIHTHFDVVDYRVSNSTSCLSAHHVVILIDLDYQKDETNKDRQVRPQRQPLI